MVGGLGGFGGLFDPKAAGYSDPLLVAATDGVGTKLTLAGQVGQHQTVGQDLVAMCVNDLIVQGAEPLFFLDYLGLHKQDPAQTVRLVDGIAKGCEQSGCALIGGECAEMPDVYAPDDFDIAGFAVGVVELHRAIDPMRVKKDDVIIGLSSDGVHSNGFSLVRKIVKVKRLNLNRVYPELREDEDDERTLGDHLITPTRLYVKPIVKLLQQYRVKRIVSGMAHITGGGLPGNVNRAMPEDLRAVIRRDAWTVPPLFKFLQKRGGIDPDEMDRVFNMGIGYVLIVRPTFAASVVRQLNRMGEQACILGHVEKGNGEAIIK